MSILINIDMPENCLNCDANGIRNLDGFACNCEYDVEHRPKDCPLIEQITGNWVLKTFDDGYGEYQLYECDKCGATVVHRSNYCRNCGADMRIRIKLIPIREKDLSEVDE